VELLFLCIASIVSFGVFIGLNYHAYVYNNTQNEGSWYWLVFAILFLGTAYILGSSPESVDPSYY
tara:strand:- start:226 stop:420 length:195 start_codon:yes stop_codon:yes gene_type:complete